MELSFAEAMTDPEGTFNKLFTDYSKQMRLRNVSEDAIEGMQIALTIAFRLGVQHGHNEKKQPDGSKIQ
jgi:hypothetical protein